MVPSAAFVLFRCLLLLLTTTTIFLYVAASAALPPIIEPPNSYNEQLAAQQQQQQQGNAAAVPSPPVSHTVHNVPTPSGGNNDNDDGHIKIQPYDWHDNGSGGNHQNSPWNSRRPRSGGEAAAAYAGGISTDWFARNPDWHQRAANAYQGAMRTFADKSADALRYGLPLLEKVVRKSIEVASKYVMPTVRRVGTRAYNKFKGLEEKKR